LDRLHSSCFSLPPHSFPSPTSLAHFTLSLFKSSVTVFRLQAGTESEPSVPKQPVATLVRLDGELSHNIGPDDVTHVEIGPMGARGA